MTTTYTINRQYPKPGFDDEPFIETMHEFADAVDADIGVLTAVPGVVVEAWAPSTDYVIGERILDTADNRIYQVLVNHTSGDGEFEEDREDNPTYWQAFGVVMNPMGQWSQDTAYDTMDFVYDTVEGVSAICVTPHTSTATGDIRDDVSNWVFLIDIQATVNADQQFQNYMHNRVFGA